MIRRKFLTIFFSYTTLVFLFLILLDYRILRIDPFPFPTSDLLVWKEEKGSLILDEILSPIRYNPYFKKDYFQQGDILKRVNYIKIYSKKELNEFLFHLNIGSVVLYHIERGNDIQKRFVFISPEPRLLWAKSHWTWDFAILVNIFALLLLSLTSSIFELFERPAFIHFYSHFNLMLLFITLFQVIRSCLYYLDFHFEINYLKVVFYYGYLSLLLSLFLFNVSILFLYPYRFFEYSLILGFSLLVSIFFSLFALPHFHAHFLPISESILFLSNSFLLPALAIRFFKKFTKYLIIFAIPYLFFIFYFQSILDIPTTSQAIWSSSTLLFLLIGVLWLSPHIRLLKLIRPWLQFIFLFSSFIGFLSFYHYLLGTFAQGSIVRRLIELVLVFATYGFFYIVYIIGKQFFHIPFLHRNQSSDPLLRWLATISHYTNPHKLITDFEKHLVQHRLADQVKLITNPQINHSLKVIVDHFKRNIKDRKLENVRVWAKNPLFAEITLSESLAKELSQKWDFLFYFQTQQGYEFLLCLTTKLARPLSIDEIQLLKDTFRQVALYLEVLYYVEEEKTLREKTLQAELKALRSQINPHFLFNTLNTISALIHEQPELAEQAVEHLAFLFRKTLQLAEHQFTPLKDELEFIQKYLAIEIIRFGDRLKIHWDIDEEILSVPIPTLLLQTIVENAIKHGAYKTIGEAHIFIRIKDKENYIFIEIEDNGPGIDLSKIETSIGLKNIITRLKVQYRQSDLIQFFNTGKGTCIQIKIPKFGNKSST